MSDYKHVMVAIAFDEDAHGILKKTAAIAKAHQAKMSVIHVDPDIASFYEGIIDIDLQAEEQSLHHESVDLMKKLLSKINYPIHKHILHSGEIESATLKAVKAHDVDLLALGHHKSGIFRQALLSPSQPIVRDMPCDVLLIKLGD